MNGILVGEGVNVGAGVEVRVRVGDKVTVALCVAVGLCVAVAVSASGVNVTVRLAGKVTTGVCVAVPVGGIGGVKKKLEISASSRRSPIMMGKAYLRSLMGRVIAGTTGAPTYPNVLNRLFRLAA